MALGPENANELNVIFSAPMCCDCEQGLLASLPLVLRKIRVGEKSNSVTFVPWP